MSGGREVVAIDPKIERHPQKIVASGPCGKVIGPCRSEVIQVRAYYTCRTLPVQDKNIVVRHHDVDSEDRATAWR